MKSSMKFMLSAAALAIVTAGSAVAATQTVTEKTSTVHTDGSVSYQSHTVVKDANAAPVVASSVVTPVTFYYYDTDAKAIIAQSDLNEDVYKIWDRDNNTYIDNHEFYDNALVVYEPVEFSKRTYQDVDLDGRLELTQEEYTFRLQQLPYYSKMNSDKKDGLTVYEFTGLGFREVDVNSDNQVSYDELKKAFYGQAWNAKNPDLYN